MSSQVRLGTVRVPSGILVVVDPGYAGLWCQTAQEFADDSGWPLSDNDCQIVKDSVDIRVIGPNAAEAGGRFNRQWHPLWLYDIPRHAVAEMKRLFHGTVAPLGLDATVVVNHQRVDHRERVRYALEHGGGTGEIQIAGVWASVCGAIPADRDLPVFAEPMPSGPDHGRWRRVYVEIEGHVEIASSQRIGCTGVDWARLMFADADALGEWRHNDALDGKADCVFWGRDAEALAHALGAPRLGDTQFGWHDLPVGQGADRVQTVEQARVDRGWKLAIDFRPHSHHWQLMRQIRASTSESGTVELSVAKAVRIHDLLGRWDLRHPSRARCCGPARAPDGRLRQRSDGGSSTTPRGDIRPLKLAPFITRDATLAWGRKWLCPPVHCPAASSSGCGVTYATNPRRGNIPTPTAGAG